MVNESADSPWDEVPDYPDDPCCGCPKWDECNGHHCDVDHPDDPPSSPHDPS